MAGVISNALEGIRGVFEPKDEREFLPAALEVVETPASPTSRILAFLIIAFFVFGVIWAFVGRVDILATAQGRILPAGDVKIIQPLDPGIVRAIRVQDGDHVRRGQLLIELDPTEPLADTDRLSRDLVQAQLDVARLSALKAGFLGGGGGFVAPPGAPADRVAEAQAAMRAQADQQAAKVADLTQQVAQKAAEIDEVAAQLDKTRADLPLLEEKDRINKTLAARGYGTTLSGLDAAQALSEARHDLAIAGRRREEAMAAREALVRQRQGVISQFQAEVLSDLRKAQEQQNELSQDLIKAQNKSSETELRAPNDGIVEQLAVHTLHGVVLPGQHLLTIVPDTRNLMIEAKLANKDVGFVHAGQSVKVKVETFNFTRYGIVDGKVVDVSRDTVEQDQRPITGESSSAPELGATPVPKVTSPTYIARISLSRTSMIVDGEPRALQPGMSVTADIRTGSRSIADYLISPIARKTQESLHER
jgi:hemolysin D